MQIVNDQMNYFSVDKMSKCKKIALTLVRSPRLWFNGLLDWYIESWIDFYERFSAYFTSWFTQVTVEVEGAEEGLKYWIFENGLLRDCPFRLKIGMKKVKTTQETLSMAESYMILV